MFCRLYALTSLVKCDTLLDESTSSMKRKEKKRKEKKMSAFSFPATHFLTVCMYVSMYCTEVKGDARASIRERDLVILFLTSVVHNSVVCAVLYVTRKMFGIICTFSCPT